MENIVIYNEGELELNVSVENETVWLNRSQLSELFGRDLKTIGKHINNVFREGELDKVSTVSKFAIVQNEGGREVKRDIEYYNLDVIISIGYRVKSQRGVRFRQWAITVLKSYIQNGFVINSEKITNERFVSLENDVNFLKDKVQNISNQIEDKTLKPTQGIFYDGQVFDAYAFVSNLIREAKQSIILIDNYVDDTTLTIFSKVPNIKVTIYTHTITKQLKLDLEKYNTQYNNITLRTFKNSHDRFLIIDEKELYHVGASLKDLGKKWFAFSKMDIASFVLLNRLK